MPQPLVNTTAISRVMFGTAEIYKGYVGSVLSWFNGFPSVVSTTRSNKNTSSTGHSVVLPASVDTDDILIVIFNLANTSALTWDNSTAGTWTNLFSTTSTSIRLAAYYKIADGTEDGKTLSLSSATAGRSAWHIYRIRNGKTVSCGTSATGNSTAPNPPSLTPSWGAKNTLWLAVMGTFNQTADGGSYAYPTNYTTNGIYDEAANASGCGVGSSYRTNNATSEDPAAWTINATLRWVANTIAVEPIDNPAFSAGGGGATPVIVSATHAKVSGSSAALDIVIAKPSGMSNGDLLVATLTNFTPGFSSDWSTPSGWTLASPESDSQFNVVVMYRYVDGSEGADFTFHSSWCQYELDGIVMHVTGAATSSPIEALSFQEGSSGTPTAPSITTLGDNRRLVAAASSFEWFSANPSGYSAVSGVAFDVYWAAAKEKATAGASGTAAFTTNNSEDWNVVHFAIKPT